MRSVEKEGKTTEEAIEKALEELGAKREEARIEILDRAERKVFGLWSSKGVKVRATLMERDACMEEAKSLLLRILEQMGIQAQVLASRGSDHIYLEVKSAEVGLLIGRRGKTLDALQYLLNRILNREGAEAGRVVIEAEGYRARRQDEIRSFALRSATKAKSTGQEVVLAPLTPYERRIVHLCLQQEAGVRTFSEGEGYLKKIHVVPIDAA
jgi:spoIIIJ-associated protein